MCLIPDLLKATIPRDTLDQAISHIGALSLGRGRKIGEAAGPGGGVLGGAVPRQLRRPSLGMGGAL